MVRATLVTDGSSDTVLIPILRWVLQQSTSAAVEFDWADTRLYLHGSHSLQERVACALRYYPCELLFVHRDAESQSYSARREEIIEVVAPGGVRVCPIVPVRMQEAWLLHDEYALREAAGRPSGRESLELPSVVRLEQVTDPKGLLHEKLRAASGARGRRARRFRPAQAAHRLADLISDWAPLRVLPAFQFLERDTRSALSAIGLPVLPESP